MFTLGRCLSLSLFLLALIGCGDSGDPKGGGGKTSNAISGPGGGEMMPTADDVGDMLVIGLRGEPDGWLSVVQQTATAQMLSTMTQPQMTDSDFQDGKLIYLPYVAERWEFNDDNTELTFHLNKDLKWPDGKPITAHDVQFTYALVAHPDTGSPRRPYLDNMRATEPVEVVDDHTVRFHFKWAYNKTTMVAHASSVELCPKHLLENVEPSTLRQHELHKKKNFGYGYYKMLNWKPNDSLLFQREPGFAIRNSNGGVPYIDKLLVRIIPEYQTQLQALKNNQIDVIESVQEKDIEQVSKWDNVKVYTKGYRFMDYLCWNLKNPLFADKEVRHALTMAIDIKGMMNALLTFGGKCYGVQAYSTITPELIDYRADSDIKLLPYDIEKAKKMFAAAGWKDSDGDGVLDKDGKKFEFTLATNTGNPRRAEAVVFVQRDLKRVGIVANIERIEPVQFFDNLSKKKFEAALAGWSSGLFVDPANIWGSPTDKDPKPFNQCSYSNAEVDKLIEKGKKTADLEVEKQCWKRMQKLIYDDQPYTFLFWRSESFAVSSRVRGVEPNILSTYHGIQKWWVPKAQHKYKN